jgi:Ni/Co efflux regulator RcnB
MSAEKSMLAEHMVKLGTGARRPWNTVVFQPATGFRRRPFMTAVFRLSSGAQSHRHRKFKGSPGPPGSSKGAREMKRLIMSLAAVAAVAGPIAASATQAHADPRWDHREDRWERRDDRWDRRHDRRDDRWDRRDDRHDRRHHDRWDNSRYNGYYYRNKWYYGPPPAAYYSDPYYRPGYSQWRRGAYLPPNYRGYVVRDYHRYHLRPPPRGYEWRQVGNDYLLVALATGLIFEIINN